MASSLGMTGVRANESLSQLLDAPDGENGASGHSGVVENGGSLVQSGNQEEAAKVLYGKPTKALDLGDATLGFRKGWDTRRAD